MSLRLPHFILIILAACVGVSLRADVVINEIHFRPAGIPENTKGEFIELHNTGAVPVSVAGWQFDKGVSFTFAAGTNIPAGGYLVVAADLPTFIAQHPGVTNVVGNFSGALANTGEEIKLVDALGISQDSVSYYAEGDWAVRVRETVFNGWDWSSLANGGGRTLELRNAALDNDNGQNWTVSAAAGGTPGAANGAASANVAPIISSVKHSPASPRSNEAVTISCKLLDETPASGLTATLFWRNATTATPGAFNETTMAGDGAGKFFAVLPPMANLTIVEFYVQASDGALTRTWPAPTSEGQNANCQYQVTNEVFTATDAYYLLVLTGAENAAYNALAPLDTANNKLDRFFNTTLVVVNGTDTTIRYRSQIRFRGNSSRTYQFKPLRVSIPGDDPWDGGTGFNLNPRASYLQYMGMRLLQASGVRAPDSIPVKPRRNGVEYTTSTGNTPDFGRWVREEDINGNFVSNHFPEAKSGGIYKKVRPDRYWRNTGWTVPANADGSIDGWLKQNNSAANDWSDLTGFFATAQTVNAPHFPGSTTNDVAGSGGASTTGVGNWNGTAFSVAEITTLENVADLDQWARWFAVMTIFEDYETNISNGQDDDYAIYFAPGTGGKRRAHLLTHDMDTIFGLGDIRPAFNAVGLFDMTEGGQTPTGGSVGYAFRPLLPLFGNTGTAGNAAFRQKYYDALRQLLGTVFDADNTANPNPPFYQFVDSHLTGWVSAANITAIKDFVRQRRTYLLGLIGSGAITPAAPTSTTTLAGPHGNLFISEVLARNVATLQNGATFPDFIEIRNDGATTADLGGMSLTDDPLLPAKYVFPAGTSIASGAHLVVFADADAAAPGLHTGFALDQDGDTVRLHASATNGGALLDSITFGPQAADLSISRTGAALDVWALTQPTPDAANATPVALGNLAAIRINEIASNPDYLFTNDFVEIYNPGAQTVALGGVAVTDDFINYPVRHVMPALSFIGTGDFLVLRPKGGSASPGNPTELAFKLGATTATATIFGANGTQIDSLDLPSLPQDFSRGRTPDGGTTLAYFGLPGNIPTPGAANTAPPAGVLALLNQLRVTEILCAPNELEFIELQNAGATALDLSGVRFTDGIGYTFAPGTTLAPGAFIVVCADRAAFITRFGAIPALAPGVFTGTLDNADDTITLQPPPPWDVNVLSFTYSGAWFPETDLGHSLVVISPSLTAARDWEEKETWKSSAQLNGNPGVSEPPAITSSLSADGVLDTPFSYQILATQSPASYSASGLPTGLGIDTATGIISGSPTQAGSFNVSIGAANTGGAGSATLVLNVAAFGAISGFEWSAVGSQTAGLPFTPTLRARDTVGHTVTTYNGPADISAQAATPSARVVFTEFGTSTPTPDYFEIQNVGTLAANTSGWVVLTNQTSTGVNAALGTAWSLPATLAPGQITGAVDAAPLGPNETLYGADIDWPGANPRGWAMLVDGSNVVRDFVAWGYTAAELATIAITRNGATLTIAGQWSGAGAATIPAGQSLFRSGSGDGDVAADWSLAATPSPRSAQNTGLTVLWLPAFTPIATTPSGTVNLVNGVWSQPLTLLGASTTAELQAVVTGFPLARSNSFVSATSTVNFPPVFTKGANQISSEDGGPQTTSGWATGILPGLPTETGQIVTFLVSSDNPALFTTQPAVTSGGTLTYQSALNASGTATVTLRARDNGGGNDTSDPQTFTITILPVNDAPTLTAGASISVPENSGPQNIGSWASGIGPGAANESAQTLAIQLTATAPALFAVQPAVALDGTLTFTPATNVSGTATVTVTISDDGGTANGGSDATQRTFSITLRPINHAPAFTAGGSKVITGIKTTYSQDWATGISAGDPSESSQLVVFLLSNDRPDLFTIAPAISPAGRLTFTAGSRAGLATITVRLKDNAGTTDGGVDTSAPITFKIRLTSAGEAVGVYRGLAGPPPGMQAEHARLGSWGIAVTSAGTFTGRIYLGGTSWPLIGRLTDTGLAVFGRFGFSQPLVRAGKSTLTLKYNVDFSGSTPRLVGRIFDGVAPFAELPGERDGYSATHRVPTALRDSASLGNYTAAFISLPAPNGGLDAARYPRGDGWAIVIVNQIGVVDMRGQLADGTAFTYASALNAANSFPFYLPLYTQRGGIGAQIAFNTTAATRIETASLLWYRPAIAGALYPLGWRDGIALGLDGSPRNLITRSNALPIGSATLTFADGGITPAPLSRPITIGPLNRVTIPPPNPQTITLVLRSTGAWGGTFFHPVTRRKISFQGVILDPRNEGTGFFIGGTESGGATFTPAP